VACRIRPLNNKELTAGDDEVRPDPPPTLLHALPPFLPWPCFCTLLGEVACFQIWEVVGNSIKDTTAEKVYHYDQCYGDASTNEGSNATRSKPRRYPVPWMRCVVPPCGGPLLCSIVGGVAMTCAEIFEALGEPLLNKVSEGYNGTIFAYAAAPTSLIGLRRRSTCGCHLFRYGQTSSGKTHTLIGDPSSPGLAVRAESESASGTIKHS
jgi:hypothetical protein